MEELTKKEVYERMKEWRNMKKMYSTALSRIEIQKEEIRELKETVCLLKAQVKLQEEVIQQQKLQIEELQRMVFKKKKKDTDKDASGDTSHENKKSSTPRTKDSYQRAVPTAEEVTAHVQHHLSACPDCKTPLTKISITTYYEEDIPLPTDWISLKQVTAHHVEKGYCTCCRQWRTAIPIPSSRVVLGKNVRLYICYLSLLLRCSFEQIHHLLKDTYDFLVSDGEIRNILVLMANKLQPEYEALKERIRISGRVHLDETSWGEGWLWVAADARSEDVVYVAANSRGKGHAEELLGKKFVGIRITDGYPGYTNLSGNHQLCWAHPHRKVRDLKTSSTLPKSTLLHCVKTYEHFSEIYEALRVTLLQPFERKTYVKESKKLKKKILDWAIPHAADPKKLSDIKGHFRKFVENYLICLAYPNVPADNNRAERELRHFVIKRKISFGNKSAVGAHAFEILASVLMSLWRKTNIQFFPMLSTLV